MGHILYPEKMSKKKSSRGLMILVRDSNLISLSRGGGETLRLGRACNMGDRRKETNKKYFVLAMPLGQLMKGNVGKAFSIQGKLLSPD